jgi:putative isomerase
MSQSRLITTFLSFSACCIGISTAAENTAATPPKQIHPGMTKVYKDLAQGWNTWNTHSLTSHILLPERLEINIGFIDEYNSNYVTDFSGSHKPVYGEHGIRGEYTDISLAVHNKPFRIETAAVGQEFLIKITPSKEMMGTEYFSVTAGAIWGGEVNVVKKGNTLVATHGNKTLVLEAVSKVGKPTWDPTRGAHLVFGSDQPVYLRLNSKRTPTEIDAALVKAKADFLASVISSDGDLEEGLAAMRRVLLWNTVFDPQSGKVLTPVNRSWTRLGSHFGHYVIFGWDTFFGGLMLGMIDKNLAYANVHAMLEKSTPNGMVPNWGAAGGHVSMDRSEPQVGAWCAYKLYLQYGDKWFLESCYDQLLAWNDWRFRERDKNSDGLMELGSVRPKELPPGVSQRFAADQSRSGLKTRVMWESGLDNSPMWDKAECDAKTGAMKLEYVGLNGLMAADCRTLASMAKILGKKKDQKMLTQRADALSAKIDAKLWNEKKGIYMNRDWNGKFEPTLSLTHFYPMLSGDVPEDRVNRLVNDYLINPNEFWTNYVIPNVPKSEKSFQEQAYWRGRVWAPTNFLVTEGCRRHGRDEIASKIAARGLDLLLVAWRERGAVCENFNAIEGKGKGDNRNDPFYTWGSLMSYICIQEFFDAQVWNNEIKLGSTRKPSGKELRNIPFRNGKLTITADGDTIVKSANGKTVSTHKGATRIDANDLADQLK